MTLWREPCKNWRTDRDAVWELSWLDLGNHVLDGCSCSVAPTRRDTLMYGLSQSIGFWESCAKTAAPILTIYTSYDMFLPKKMPFGDRDKAAPHLWGYNPPNPPFFGRDRSNLPLACTLMLCTPVACIWFYRRRMHLSMAALQGVKAVRFCQPMNM